MWAFVCVLPVTATQALLATAGKAGPASASVVVATNPALVAIGGLIFLAGFALETVADAQKFAFKKDPANRGKFIGARGVYKYSQYPNYAGEMAVWSGVWLASGPAVWVAAPWTVLSPLFTILLLTKVSGIPLAEEKNKRLYSQDSLYQTYKRKTPLLLPWFPQQ
jgi:steroid 5-alpha reductase family enzyme